MSAPGANDRPGPEQVGGFRELLHAWRYFFGLLGLVLLIGLFFVEENWRGERAWSQYKQALAARGEPVEFTAFVPPTVPDDKNFAMTPLLAPLFGFVRGTSPSSPLRSIGLFATNYDAAAHALAAMKAASSNSWIKARTDFPAWYGAFLNSTNKAARRKDEAVRADLPVREAAAGVLTALSEADPVFAELQEASKLPYARFNIHYTDEDPAAILLPHLGAMKHLTQVLALRASAELALGRTDQAFQDTKLLLYLTDVCKDEPFLISQIVRMEQLRLALQPVAEGMSRWSEPQLHSLQAQLARVDFCADVGRSLKAERFWASAVIEYVHRARDKSNPIGAMFGRQTPWAEFGGELMSVAPGGWFAFEQVTCSRTADECLLPTIDVAARQINPRLCRRADERIAELNQRSAISLYLRHAFFCRVLLPNVTKAAQKAAFAQTAVDCARVACALERYCRQHGQLPESLPALEPQLIEQLPHDIINGEPLKYHRAQGGYVLYSVGWNEVDDGGAVSAAKTGDERLLSQDDWVWRLP